MVIGLNFHDNNRVSFLNFKQTAENTVTMKLPPVEVLNQLGKLGYRIIGTSMDTGVKNKMVWTLELKNYDKFAGHSDDL